MISTRSMHGRRSTAAARVLAMVAAPAGGAINKSTVFGNNRAVCLRKRNALDRRAVTT